jgi:hypothetical protein
MYDFQTKIAAECLYHSDFLSARFGFGGRNLGIVATETTFQTLHRAPECETKAYQ